MGSLFIHGNLDQRLFFRFGLVLFVDILIELQVAQGIGWQDYSDSNHALWDPLCDLPCNMWIQFLQIKGLSGMANQPKIGSAKFVMLSSLS